MVASFHLSLLYFFDLLLALILGAIIGLERELADKEAGLRTFSLISLGSALFVIIQRFLFIQYPNISVLDPSRVLGQIVVGVGFLGAGMIIFERNEGKIKGLTTAAGVWTTAAIGAAAGFGLIWLAILSTLLVILIFVGLHKMEMHFVKKFNRVGKRKK